MPDAYIASRIARPTKSGVYAVRYLSLYAVTGEKVVRDAYAYWDNASKQWHTPAIVANMATGKGVNRTVVVQFWRVKNDNCNPV